MLSDQIMTGTVGINKTFSNNHVIGAFHSFKQVGHPNGHTTAVDGCSVDIIIPYHGRYDLVRKALLSVIRYTTSNPYQITLVDDGSPGQAAKEFQNMIIQAPQTQCLRLEQQSGFGAAINYAIENTSQPYICILHSDCEVRHINWLESLGEALVLNKDKNVRFVSPMTNFAGDDDFAGKIDYNVFNSQKITTEENIIIADEPLPFYCFMCHRELFNRIGKIKPYPYTWFENEEFFHRMIVKNYKQAIVKNSWIQHKGSETVNYILQSASNAKIVNDELAKNRTRCIADLKLLYR